MKIVHIINNLAMGGAEKLMSTLLPELQNEGVSVELICLQAQGEAAYLQPLTEANIPVHYLSQHRSPYSLLNLFALGKRLRQIHPDLIHVHLFPAFYWTTMAAFLFGLKQPLVMTEHDTSNRRIRSRYWKYIDRWMYRPYHSVICISDGVKDVITRYMPFLRTKTIYNGVPLQLYTEPVRECKNQNLKDLLHKLRENPENRILVSVGRLVEKKNQQTMIRSMALLPETCYLLLAGEGDQREPLERLIAELSLEKRVILLGNQSDIPYLVQHADAGILTSTIEGFGLAAVEMMAAGLPVVCSEVPGLLEVSGHPSLGAHPNNPTAFAEIVRRLFDDKDYYQNMKISCRQKAGQFSLQAMAGNYLAWYKAILQAPGHP